MNINAASQQRTAGTSTDFEILSHAVSVLRHEAEVIESFSRRVPVEFAQAARAISDCRGAVIVTGIGKAGWVGQKISASLASTGTRSHFLHAAEAFHGDFGRIDPADVLLTLSNSGETGEITRMMPVVAELASTTICITANEKSTLARQSDIAIAYGRVIEACDNNLAPTASTSLMMAIGDALALAVSRIDCFTPMDFARFHPGGSLGRRLQTACQAMRPLSDCRATAPESTIREAILESAKQGRRTGAILILDPQKKLLGIFTDSDLVKILEQKQDSLLDQPISCVMSHDPFHVHADQLVGEAIELLKSRNISELPVVDSNGVTLGLIDITDVIC